MAGGASTKARSIVYSSPPNAYKSHMSECMLERMLQQHSRGTKECTTVSQGIDDSDLITRQMWRHFVML